MEHRRRALDAGPAEHLLLPASVIEVAGRLPLWRAFSGLDEHALLLSPLSATPLPMPWTVPDGRRRWPELRPEAMWHPLLWLPARLSAPAVRRDPLTGAPEGETYDEWATRVVLEMTESSPVVVDDRPWVLLHDPGREHVVRPAGPQDDRLVPLFDPATGTWLDVLSTVGLDVDEPGDVARVRDWLDGGTDADLDGIDLDRFLHAAGRNPEWARDRAARPLLAPGSARTYVDDLRDASSALVARELDGEVARLDGDRLPPREAGRRLGLLARLASTFLSPRVDSADDIGLALGLATARADRATTPEQARSAAEVLRAVLGSVAETSAIGIERLEVRAVIETAEVRERVATITAALRDSA
ncbi:hypothetical protein LEP48_03045 [Isoptericola sp. NEAU-Y5]|uniref:Uncharacterized protein n=1 Tax=Isoptericola luteus TaxID=2879484 RepID=A0ABS7ZCZ6_9MICO|nr:hypothetical protein [Isoptericola sp. NEAU-Y5]MCA5892327.1 hypothetical protein [Isoptericola sp. NEAU-Y5]